MIVNRLTFRVKPGCMEEVLKMVKAERAKLDNPKMARIYTPNIGRFDLLVEDLEFENLAEFDKFWTAWGSKPETAEFMEKWETLVETGGFGEIWNLEE